MAKSPLTFVQAVAQARESYHGSYNYGEAMTVIFRAYREANPDKANQFITLDALWGWVEERLNALNNSEKS